MKLHEALATGRRIRFKQSEYISEREWFSPKYQPSLFDMDEILSDAWEVEPEPKKPLTAEIEVTWKGNANKGEITLGGFKEFIGKRTKVTIEEILE